MILLELVTEFTIPLLRTLQWLIVLLRLKFKTLTMVSQILILERRRRKILIWRSSSLQLSTASLQNPSTLSKNTKHQCSGLTVPSVWSTTLSDMHRRCFFTFFRSLLKWNLVRQFFSWLPYLEALRHCPHSAFLVFITVMIDFHIFMLLVPPPPILPYLNVCFMKTETFVSFRGVVPSFRTWYILVFSLHSVNIW